MSELISMKPKKLKGRQPSVNSNISGDQKDPYLEDEGFLASEPSVGHTPNPDPITVKPAEKEPE